MKTACFIAATLAFTATICAQVDPDALPSTTTPPAAPAAPALSTAATNEPLRETHIDSDSAEFDLNQRTAIYRDHVHVTDPQMSLRCDWLMANLPQAGHIDQIIARTNVVIDFVQDGQTTHVTSDNAVYHYKVANGVTNETVELTGNPHVVDPHQNVTADKITWDRVNNGFRFEKIHGTFVPADARPPAVRPTPETNAPAIDTNQPVG